MLTRVAAQVSRLPFTGASTTSIRYFSTVPTSTKRTRQPTSTDITTIQQDDAKYILGTYARFPRYIVRGKGAYIWDGQGKRYLDFNSGIAVNSLGHVHPTWLKAIIKQAPQICHISNLFYSQPQVDLAKRLVTNSSFQKAFFCNSGTEANEACLKFARKYSYTYHQQHHKDKPYTKFKIVAFNGGFHGRTMGALTMTYKQAYKAPFGPLLPGVSFVDYNDIKAAEAAIDEDVCAVIVEPIQGEGGVNVATREFLHALRKRCDEKRALLIFDEVQCGLGRSGSLWAHTGFGIEPDLMSLAKPLAGGLPIGAVLLKQHVADVMKPGDHGTTFAGGALIGRAAIATFDIINHPDFLKHVRDIGAYLVQECRQLQDQLKAENNTQRALITEIRHPPQGGLLVGLQFDVSVTNLINKCAEQGLLLISAGDNVVRLAPPLIITERHVNQAVNTIRKVLLKYTKEELNAKQS